MISIDVANSVNNNNNFASKLSKIVKTQQGKTTISVFIFKFRAIDVTMHASGKITFNFLTKASWRLYGIR